MRIVTRAFVLVEPPWVGVWIKVLGGVLVDATFIVRRLGVGLGEWGRSLSCEPLVVLWLDEVISDVSGHQRFPRRALPLSGCQRGAITAALPVRHRPTSSGLSSFNANHLRKRC